jgi:hypothetical protein
MTQVEASVGDLSELSGSDARLGPRVIGCGLALMLFLLLCIVSALRGPAYEEVSPRRGVSTPSAETKEVGVRMVSLQVGDERGEESHEVLHDTQEFHTASGAIYVTAFVNGPMGGPVKGTLTAIDGKLGTRKVVSEQLGGVAEGFPAADKKVWFKFARPASGWQAGKYEVRVGTEKLALGKVYVTVR